MLSRPLFRWFGAALTLGFMAASPVFGSDIPKPVDSSHFCPGSMDVPLHLVLVAPEGNIAPGSTTILEGSITADVDLSNVRLTIGREGSVRLLGPPDLAIGQVQQGLRSVEVPVEFQITRALAPDRAAVLVTVTAENAETHVQYQKQDGVFAITRGGQFRAAEGAYVTAELKAIKEDLRASLITDEVADQQLKGAVTVPGAWSQSPAPVVGQSPGLEAFRAVLGALQPTPAKPVQPQLGANHISSGNVTFSGNISWRASDNSDHGAYGMSVTVWESIPPLFIPIPVASVATGTDGNYSMNVFVPPLTTCFVDFVTSNSAVALTPGLPPLPYGNVSPLTFDPGGGSTVVWNFDAANTGTGPAVGLESMVTFEAASVAIRNGNTFLGFFPVVWPGLSGSAFYNGVFINLRPLDRYAYDVEYHEYGHYVMDSFNFENNPGGPHNIGDCIANVHSSKDQGVRLAWGEGWPTYWGTTAQRDFGLPGLGIPTVGDASYTDTEAGNFSYSLENDSSPPASQDGIGRGEDNEIAVQRILWDLVDSNSDNRDAVAISDVTLLNLFRGTNIERLSQAWGLIRGTLSNAQQLSFGAITTDADVGPRPTAPANNAVVSTSANKTFTWAANVGCPSSYSGDGFSLRFFTPSGTPVLTLGGLGSPTRTISNGELATLVAAGHNLKWAVEGSHSGSPATGPYLGDNRSIVVDNPPIADAGPDQLNVECASHTTTSVQLNGTGSSDPDGDALTYSWSAPGVVFNNASSATPIGQFHQGTTIVTLTVSDGILSDTDQMTVRVVDTTPPVIACPADITVECNSHCGVDGGVPATDPAIVAFLAGASATDICDATLTVGPDGYPACFPDGDTVIHFTATDSDNNASHCTATVHVIDTTPPTIAVSLDRTVLWPPNHKMVTINATVSVADVCDPNPTFVLVSIVSNEPDNGLGDGDTVNDIQGASYGTADTQFQLRSERQGIGTGRRYTITYRGSDSSGNSTDAVVVVRVPHDQHGSAIAADGWDADGSGFAAGAQSFAVVIRSVARTVVDEGGEIGDVQTGGTGGSAPGATDLLFNARAVDEMQVMVGNSAGALTPLSSYRLDVDGDGLSDLVSFYRVADAQALAAASTLEDGPVGLHYNTRAGGEYLVDDIFLLGTPIVLPDLGITVAGGHGGGRGTGGIAAEGQGQVTDAAGQSQVESKPAAEPAAGSNLNPATTELAGVYPNPVRSDASVVFSLAREGAVDLSVYDVRGARVRTLRSGVFGAGRYTVRWDGRDDSGRRIGGGMYFVRLSAGHYSKTLKTAIMP